MNLKILKKIINFLVQQNIKKTFLIKLVILSIFMNILGSVYIAIPIFIQKFIDNIQLGLFSLSYPIKILITYVILFFIKNFFVYIYGKLYIKTKNELQLSLIVKILKQNPLTLKDKGEGFFFELIEQTLDTLIVFLTPPNIGKFFLILNNIIMIVIISFYDKIVGILCLMLFIFYYLSFLMNNKLFSDVLEKYIKSSSESNSIIYDFLKNNKLLIGHNEKIDFAKEIIQKTLLKTSKLEFKLQYFFDLLFVFVDELLKPSTNIIVIALLGKKVINNEISFGILVAIITYFSLIQKGFSAFQDISDLIFRTKGALASLENFVSNYKANDLNNIENKDFFYSFKNVDLILGENTIIKNFSLTLEKNKNYALIGTSGQGKSSIINILLGLIPVTNGKLYFLNTENEVSDFNTLKYIAWFSQDSEIFNLSLEDNIFLGDKFNNDEFEYYVFSLELEKLLNRKLGSNGNNISGGEKQRVALARFLHQLKSMEFYIIDEGFIAVDEVMKKKMLNLVKESIKNKTGICISHDSQVIKDLSNKLINISK